MRIFLLMYSSVLSVLLGISNLNGKSIFGNSSKKEKPSGYARKSGNNGYNYSHYRYHK